MKVVRLFVCADKGLPMVDRNLVYVREGAGIAGDRYATGRGAYSNSKRVAIRHISLIASEAIAAANAEAEVPFLPEETRRNIVTEGVDLNGLVGRTFLVGNVIVRGVELCDPCARPSKLTGKPNFEKLFEGRGGLRVEALTDGKIEISSPIDIF